MSDLPGNPHDNVNVDFADTNDGRINGEAILTLAYEQRTANMIGVLEHLGGTNQLIWQEIYDRLGLGEKK